MRDSRDVSKWGSMSRSLPGAAKYASRRQRLVAPLPCSVQSCVDPAHTPYRTALGYSFCMTHKRRYLLLLLAQCLYPDCMTTRDTVNASELRIWIGIAIDGNDQSVEQHLQVHSSDLARFCIDERVL